MKNVVILNGPAGVGKTTVGRLLAAKSRNGVCIEGDVFKNFIVTKEESTVEGRLGYKNGVSLIQNFLDAGYQLIVFEYVFPSKDQIDYFLSLLQKDAAVHIHIVTLWAPLEIIVAREADRPNRERLGERVVQCYEELRTNLDSLGEVISTEEKTPEIVADEIFSRLEKM